MSKNDQQYIEPNDFTQVNKAYLSEEDKFGASFLDITNAEQEAMDIEMNRPQAAIIISKQQYTNLPEENHFYSSKQLTILQRLLHITNRQLSHLPELLKEIAQEICDGIDSVQFCLMVLQNPQNQQLELVAKIGTDVDKLVFPKLGNVVECHPKNIYSQLNLLDKVFATGVAGLFQTTIEKNENVNEYTPSSMYAVPIDSPKVGRLGVLAIGNWDNPYAFDVISQKMLDGVTDLIAIAIHHTKVRQALEQQEKTLATQTEILLSQQSELEKKQNQIKQQNLQLIKAANLKSQFLATTSHELRTPLNVILGLSQVLLRQRSSTLTAQQVDMVERILSNGNHLGGIIEDMLDFAKVEAGYFTLKPKEFNLSTLVLTTVAEHRSLAIAKNLNLQTDINLNHPLVVNDSRFLQQVLVKLLSNAIKFTETGNIVVKLWEISPDKIAIAVQDSGIGIAESDIEDIFEPLHQVDQTITRKYEGTGLGLAITKSFVELMQGKISLTSKLSEGSTFYIELPKKIASSISDF